MKISKDLWCKGLDEYFRVVDTSKFDSGYLDDLIFEPAVLLSAIMDSFSIGVRCVCDGKWVASCWYGDIGEGSNHWEAIFRGFISVCEYIEDASK